MNTAIKEITLLILSLLGGLGLLAGGAGYLLQSYKGGSKKEKNEIVSSADQVSTFWKEQAEGYKAMAEKEKENAALKDAEWNKKFTELSREVGEINGKLAEKEKQASMYLDILNNRDPEMKKFMELMVKAATDQSKVNAETVRILGEIHTLITDEQAKQTKIVSTVTHE